MFVGQIIWIELTVWTFSEGQRTIDDEYIDDCDGFDMYEM